MYVPGHFTLPDAAALGAAAERGFGTLVVATADGFEASPVPFLVEDGARVRAHVAKGNPLVSAAGDGTAAVLHHHEAALPQPWSVTDAPADHIDGMLRAIVGLELQVRRVEGKAKLSQNRSADDARGVVAGLRATGRDDLADHMEEDR